MKDFAASSETRKTRQRALVYDIVASTGSHPTADWIYAQARRRMPNVSMGTVYRNLQVLAREGRIRAIDSWGKAARFDADLTDHHHFLCEGCGGIFDLEKPDDSDDTVRGLLHSRGFSMSSYRLEFHGRCSTCRRKESHSREKH